MASVHDKLERVRKPRVHIRFDVETEGGVVEKELPFVIGVLADLTGDPTKPLEPMANRKFIQIDRDNFNEVMTRLAPGLQMRVENTLQKDGTELAVNLKFDSIDDFEPAAVVNQIDALRSLKETRDKLRDLMSKADRSQDLESLLERVLKNTEDLKALSSALGTSGSDDGKSGETK